MAKTYRMEISATVCFSVEAESEEDAIKKSAQSSLDFSFGFELPDGTGYSDAVLYTSTEDSADVIDEYESASKAEGKQ